MCLGMRRRHGAEWGLGARDWGLALRAGWFVVPGFWGWGFVAVLYAVVEM
jgi:hypothetical protein